ncbi:MAG: DUF6353 family protein [Ruminococcus sp.]|nr:DUF6353 family protein [Ruminococcus sp.]
MKQEIMRFISKTVLKVKKHSPEILLFAGIAGGIASTVMACRATTRLSAVIEEANTQLETVCDSTKADIFKDRYTEEDAKNDIKIIYIKEAVSIAKLYAPAVIVGGLSVASILTSHNILKSRLLAVSAAYAVAEKGFRDYRNAVKEKYGDEADAQLRNGFESHLADKQTEDENEMAEAQNVNIVDPHRFDYRAIFDETNPNWEKNPDYNRMFLSSQQSYANDKLRAQGYLFLNDVYDCLGIPRTKAGQILGWVYGNKDGDGYVDFGLKFCNCYASEEDVVVGREAYVLDFNVDGNILDMI